MVIFLLGATRLEAGRFHVSGAARDMMARAFGVRRTFAQTVVGQKVSPHGTTSDLGAVLRTGELRDDAEIHTAGHRSPRPRGRCDQTLSALAVVQHDFACEFSAVICRFAVVHEGHKVASLGCAGKFRELQKGPRGCGGGYHGDG